MPTHYKGFCLRDALNRLRNTFSPTRSLLWCSCGLRPPLDSGCLAEVLCVHKPTQPFDASQSVRVMKYLKDVCTPRRLAASHSLLQTSGGSISQVVWGRLPRAGLINQAFGQHGRSELCFWRRSMFAGAELGEEIARIR